MSQGPSFKLQMVAFALVTAALLIAQIVLSRLFTATVGYYYAFMLVSLAMLGLGSGALIVQQAPRFFSQKRLGTQAAVLCLIMGLGAIGGTFGVLAVYPRLAHSEGIWTLGALFWCLFPFFLAGGTVVSLVLYHARERFHVVYAIDLGSAAVGCVIALVALATLSPVVGMLTLVTLLPLFAGALFAFAFRRARLGMICAGVSLCAVLVAVVGARYPSVSDPRHLHGLQRQQVLSRWNSFSNVRVYEGRFFTWSLSEAYPGPQYRMRDLLIDGVGGTEIVEFDGRPGTLQSYDYLDWDMTALGQQLVSPEKRQLIIGPGGGVDILQAHRRGRRDITAVEINGLVEQVVNEDLGEFSGRPYRLPGVRVSIENGRTFVRRTRETWGLITLTWVDTGGSATAMAFSENYLYTVEAYRDFLQRLEPDGCLAFMRALGHGEQVKVDAMRGIAVAYEALRSLGLQDPSQHLIVVGASSPYFGHRAMCYVLIKKTPFTSAALDRAREFIDSRRFQALWLPDSPPAPASMPPPFVWFAPTIQQVITADDRAALVRDAAFDIMPTTDDNPFYFAERAGPKREAGKAVSNLSSYLWVLLALVVPFLGIPLIPMLRRTARLGAPGGAAIGYFALLGVAFMLVEIEFFHVFAMVLGSPTYAVGVVLASLLVSSGLGSLQGKRLSGASPGWLAAAFGALVGMLVLFAFTKDLIASIVIGWPFWLRIAGSILTIGPIAFLMGLPMSTGMSLVQHRPDVMLWGWALNGALSVVSTVAAIHLAIHHGIAATFFAGTACYLLAALLIQVFRRRPVAQAVESGTP
jgi:hypothetical protein